MIFFELLFGCLLKLAPYSFFAIYPFKEHLRFSKRYTLWLTALFVFAISLFFAVASVLPINFTQDTVFNKPYSVFLVCRYLCAIWYLYIVREAWQKKLFVFLLGVISASIIYVIVTLVDKLVLNVSQTARFLPFTPHAFILTAILTAVAIPLLLLLVKRAYVPVSDSITTKESNYLAIISVLLYSLLKSEAISISLAEKIGREQISFYFTLVVTVFLIYIVIFKILFYANERLLSQQKYLQIEQQFIIQGQQYHHIYDNIENSQRMRHDLRHHMVTLEGFLNNNEINKAKTYISEFMDYANSSRWIKISENPTIDLIVGYYQELAREQNIDFQVRIDIPKDINIQDIDMSVLLGNLLENALEAAGDSQIDIPFIRLNIMCLNKRLIITLDNSFQTHPNKIKNRFLSTKGNHRGLGIGSIEHIAKKYNGSTQFDYHDQEFQSSVTLMLTS
ncbi:GHKL domain-containing protein [Vallitaleaceae bacterium 9-2]